jgi:hypothetical protein
MEKTAIHEKSSIPFLGFRFLKKTVISAGKEHPTE